MRRPRGFASDNHAGAHPDVIAAVAEAAGGDHAGAYGADPWTARAETAVRAHFGAGASVFPVFNGTAANVLCLAATCRPWEAVITPVTSHLHVDECGAPEAVAGTKLLTVPTADGKLRPDDVAAAVVRVGDEHAVQARVVSVAQSTETGTVYGPAELTALRAVCDEHGLLLHVDGARLANAAAALGVGLAEAAAGADAVSLGATKNGALAAEAVVLLRPGLEDGFRFRRKRAMQLASKMRVLSAQLEALFAGDLWQRNAAHANAMARRLSAALEGLDGVRISRPVAANGVFAVLPPAVTARLQETWPFHVWDAATGEVRLMCAWDTAAGDVDAFAADLRAALDSQRS